MITVRLAVDPTVYFWRVLISIVLYLIAVKLQVFNTLESYVVLVLLLVFTVIDLEFRSQKSFEERYR